MKKGIVFLICILYVAVLAKSWHVSYNGTGDATQGASWAQAITLDTLQVAELAANDSVYVRADGVHTLHASFDKSTTDAAATTLIKIIGVKAGTTNEGAAIDTSDWIKDSARAVVECGASYTFKTGTYYSILGLSFQGQTNNTCYLEARCVAENCKFNNNYGTANARYSLYTLQQCKILGCHFISANTSGMTAGATSLVKNCFFQKIDNATGGVALLTAGDNITIESCIFDSCRIGVSTVNRDMIRYIKNVFHACVTGISGTTDFNTYFDGNIFNRCSTNGVALSAVANSNYSRNNLRYLSAFSNLDTAGLYGDQYAVQGDPLFTAPGTNFSLQANSPAKNKGFGIDSLFAK